MSSTSVFKSAALRETTATRTPSRARHMAIERPMPRPAPVTNARRPRMPRSMSDEMQLIEDVFGTPRQQLGHDGLHVVQRRQEDRGVIKIQHARRRTDRQRQGPIARSEER